jgi:hypothetical protein
VRLSELKPKFIKRMGGSYQDHAILISEADGIFFLCPVCFKANNGAVGTHGIICWQPRVPAEITPGPGRWLLTGTSFEDLTLVGKAQSSVNLDFGPPGVHRCRAHFSIVNGAIV